MQRWPILAASGFALVAYLASLREITAPSPTALALLAALIGLGAIATASYLWRRWWLSALVVGLVSVAWVGPHDMHRAAAALVVAAFAALAGWWSTLSLNWPLTVWQAFLAVGMLVAVSLSLSALMTFHPIPLHTAGVGVVVILYFSTPPWEWAVVLTALGQSRALRPFIADRYRWTPASARHVLTGVFSGVGLVVLTALLVDLETRGFHIRVQANNPFVTHPALNHHQWWAAALVAFAVVVMAPLAEEALFRGVLFGALRKRWGLFWGSVVSATVFGLAHLDLTLLLPLAVAGLILNALYETTGSLIPSTVAHATLNTISVVTALGVGGFVR
ncbi:MAG: CPBP family intramembrane metalloprotease [Firmicutes bacterium]|nr:CPBP family intramembrane metalloprotease [Bacillota bacterium]